MRVHLAVCRRREYSMLIAVLVQVKAADMVSHRPRES